MTIAWKSLFQGRGGGQDFEVGNIRSFHPSIHLYGINELNQQSSNLDLV